VWAAGALIALAVAFAVPSVAGAAIPTRGVLVPGVSLGGVRLGHSEAEVERRWGAAHELCRVCALRTWVYSAPGRRWAGAAASFRQGRVVAVFTLGAPIGWRTSRGLGVGEDALRVGALYGRLTYRRCIGYGALSFRRSGSVTSIYTYGDVVYGFSLVRSSEPVCQ
jgi:hypothetical protein